MRRQSGFSMIELLVTMTVAGLLMYIAIPSFLTSVRNDRLVSQVNDLLGSLMYARSEAVNDNANVTVCASNTGTSCSGTNWASGWIICQDQVTPTVVTDCSGTSTIVRVLPTLSGSNTLTNDGSASKVVFTSNGSVSGGNALNFAICDSRGATFGRSLFLYVNGIARTSPTVGQQVNSTAITC